MNTKYCLIIQGKIKEENKKKEFKCDDCNKIFLHKHHLKSHTITCRNKDINIINKLKKENDKLKKEIDNLKKENKELKENTELKKEIEILKTKVELYKSDHECVQEIAKQPKNNYTSNNKYINLTPLCLTKSEIEKQVNNYFLEENFLQGQEGVANFAYNNFLLDDEGKLKYICNDPNRCTFTYKTKDGEIDKDYKANNLTSLICEDVINKSVEISNNGMLKTEEYEDKMIYAKNLEEIKNLKENNTKFAKKLTSLTLQKLNKILYEDDDDDDDEDNTEDDNSNEETKEEEIEYEILSCGEEEEDSDKLLPLYNKFMKDESDKLTIEDIKEGVNGYVNFALNNTFKNRIKCTEYSSSRQILSYIDKNNKTVTESGYGICERFLKSLYVKTMSECEKCEEEIKCKIKENKDITESIGIEYTNILNKIKITRKEIANINKGKCMESEFLDDFIDELCKRLKQ